MLTCPSRLERENGNCRVLSTPCELTTTRRRARPRLETCRWIRGLTRTVLAGVTRLQAL